MSVSPQSNRTASSTAGYATRALLRRTLWALLALAPATIGVNYLTDAGDTLLFVLACAALIPLAWLIGEATEHAAEHTGPGIGGFLNASFGNAPELIIALVAVSSNLPQVVRGSLAGSVISNLLLVLGVAQLVGPDGAEIDRRSLLTQLGLCAAAIVLVLPVVVLGYTGDPERNAAVIASIPLAVVLLVLYVTVTFRNLRRHRKEERHEAAAGAWSLPASLAALGIATALTAIVSEILVHSLHAFAQAVGASEFFISAVIVAIVGNAAEHGGAIVIAKAGKMRLASEIAISSSAQVALLVTPAVVLLSLFFSNRLPLTFRWEEIAAMAGAVLLTIAVVRDGRSKRKEGLFLVVAYLGVALGFLAAGDR
jgi:Ca2+:H+ antiporter